MLQTTLFPNHSQIDYLGKYVGRGYPFRDAAVKTLIEGILARPKRPVNLNECKETFQHQILPSVQPGKIILWSAEEISAGGPKNKQTRAQRFREVLGDCKILIAIRHPFSFVRSMYFQKLKGAQRDKNPWPSRPGRFFEPEWWLEQNWKRPYKAALSNLTYATTIDIFAESFGKDSIGVFLFEQLVEDQPRFIRRLCSFIGINEEEGIRLCEQKKSNPQLTELQVERIKAISRSPLKSLLFRCVPIYFRRRIRWLIESPAESPRAQFNLSEEWRTRIEDWTRAENRKLVEDWGLPLEEFDYPL
jgi:hypothetical protein